jgi:GDPmannose 4,6-dehydratase
MRHLSARDYVEGMWRILQQEEAEDFVLATGEMHSVREFVEKAFTHVNVKIRYVSHFSLPKHAS